MQPLFNTTRFTDKGVCSVLDIDNYYVLVRYADGQTKSLPVSGVRTLREEATRQYGVIDSSLFAKVMAFEAAEQVGNFPDTTGMDLPNGERLPRKLPKQLRNLQQHGGYRPEELPRAFELWIIEHKDKVRRRVSWAEHVDEKVRAILPGMGIIIPPGVRVQKTGDREPEAEQAGGIGAYVTMPAPENLDLIPVEFFRNAEYRAKAVHISKRTGNRTIQIGNARLLLGMEKWPGIAFPAIKWLFVATTATVQATPALFEEEE